MTREEVCRYDDMVKHYMAGYCQEVITKRECEWNTPKTVPGTPQHQYVAEMNTNKHADMREGPPSVVN